MTFVSFRFTAILKQAINQRHTLSELTRQPHRLRRYSESAQAELGPRTFISSVS